MIEAASLNHVRGSYFLTMPQIVKDRAMLRLAVVMASHDYQQRGWSATAAVFKAALDFGVSMSSVWRWRKAVCGVSPADLLFNLCQLCRAIIQRKNPIEGVA